MLITDTQGNNWKAVQTIRNERQEIVAVEGQDNDGTRKVLSIDDISAVEPIFA